MYIYCPKECSYWKSIQGGGFLSNHDDVIKWKHFPRYWPFVRGIHQSPVNSPHKGQWRGALIFSLICVCIHGWVNNPEAGDLRCSGAHYDVIVMKVVHWEPSYQYVLNTHKCCALNSSVWKTGKDHDFVFNTSEQSTNTAWQRHIYFIENIIWHGIFWCNKLMINMHFWLGWFHCVNNHKKSSPFRQNILA